MILKVIGLLGGVCFAAAGIPGAVACMRAGRNPGIPVSTAALIFAGVVLLYVYLFGSFGFDWVVTVTYGVEASAWAVVLAYSLGYPLLGPR